MTESEAASSRRVQLPDAPYLAVGGGGAAWLDPSGRLETLSAVEAGRRARDAVPVVCHGPATAARLGVIRFPARDVLELFAFVRPARPGWVSTCDDGLLGQLRGSALRPAARPR